MKAIIVATLLVATFGVGIVVAAPRPDQPVLAVFDAPQSGPELLDKLAKADLYMIGAGPTLSSVIVSNSRSDTARRLYAVGARIVVDAHIATLCLAPLAAASNRNRNS